MNIGFLSNQLDHRGTGNAMYDYANYNETLLRNKSKIFTFTKGEHSPYMQKKYANTFGEINYIYGPEEIDGVDALYHIKYGHDDGFRIKIPYFVHAVFAIQPHGDKYAAVSKWLAGDKVPFVPHIVNVEKTEKTYREMIGIPQSDLVFGRYGALDTFDIPWVWRAMNDVLAERKDVWFLFANTQTNLRHDRIVYMNELKTDLGKAIFINTCDYMLHARNRGETFGLSVGEFSSRGKPVLTWSQSGEKAHLEELGPCAKTYSTMDELYLMMMGLKTPDPCYSYTQYHPYQVMQKFKKVYLSD